MRRVGPVCECTFNPPKATTCTCMVTDVTYACTVVRARDP